MQLVTSAILTLLIISPLAQATPMPEERGIPPVIWELIEMPAEDGNAVEITEPNRYTVQFLPDGKLAVRADCNQASGTYAVEDADLDIALTVSTLVLCPPDSHADRFQDLLESASTYEFDADGLLALTGESGSLRFRASLSGVLWEWQDFRGGDDSVVEPRNPQDYTLSFLPDGKIAIKADCNRATGRFKVDGPQIDLDIGGVTRAMCPPGSLMNDYLRDLDSVSTFVFRDGNLYLALPVDAGILALSARYVTPTGATPEAG
jgi:heat shock protein HslJ